MSGVGPVEVRKLVQEIRRIVGLDEVIRKSEGHCVAVNVEVSR